MPVAVRLAIKLSVWPPSITFLLFSWQDTSCGLHVGQPRNHGTKRMIRCASGHRRTYEGAPTFRCRLIASPQDGKGPRGTIAWICPTKISVLNRPVPALRTINRFLSRSTMSLELKPEKRRRVADRPTAKLLGLMGSLSDAGRQVGYAKPAGPNRSSSQCERMGPTCQWRP